MQNGSLGGNNKGLSFYRDEEGVPLKATEVEYLFDKAHARKHHCSKETLKFAKNM